MNNNDDGHSYEGLLLTSTTSNKRSLTNHFVDCVKKTKYFVPCTILSPSKTTIIDQQTFKENPSSSLKKPLEQQQPPKRGSLCIAYSISNDDQIDNLILILHVLRARQLSIQDSDKINTFVKITYPNQFEQCSKIIHGTNSPVYDEKFHIPLNKTNLSTTTSKRLTISVYNQSISNKKSDLIGCMSFNMKTLLKTTSCTKNSSKSKWYCLLPESIGRHKRMALNIENTSSQNKKTTTTTTAIKENSNNQSNGFLLNVDIYDRDEIHFSSGFPCTISEVKSAIGSSCTRPMIGDILLKINDINVSRTQAKAVKKLLRSLPLPITLQLYRRFNSSTTTNKIVLNSVDQHEPLKRNLCTNVLPEKPYKTNYSQSLLMSPINRKLSESQSDGSESGVGSESNPYSDGDQDNRLKIISEAYERDVLHLINIEKDFIHQIELGVQLYSRPLKHYLISSNEHAKLFQNIEKILAISRYQLSRLQTLTESIIIGCIGKIFHEKIQLICEAFTRYKSGYSDACLQLKQLKKCASFQRFIQGNNTNLSIEQFLQIPLNHIDNLANQLDILCCTCENASDSNYLLHVLKELRQCSLHMSTTSSSSSTSTSTSQNHCTTTMSLNSVSGTSSLMNNTEDSDIIELQNRLQFTKNIQSVVLTGRNRHVIFSGVLLLQNENKNYIETWTVLLNDMLLFTQRNAIDTRLTLVCNAIYLNDIVDFRSSDERQDALIFLSNKPNMPYKIRYPSQCLQYAWQTILEQRLKTWQRSIHDESSSADSDLE
ncbi:unnamed protein product [Adineta steineri]|uniref:Uncharacterized protein n=1 Tax=Adineta steineri TaxID=433720 RepID=A0A818HNE5_9BILA|nr:unnamed protein product [Adineta steineri]CAF3506174.1 unnamed protein product [Adineta steineri]